jgi:hypothetical protein
VKWSQADQPAFQLLLWFEIQIPDMINQVGGITGLTSSASRSAFSASADDLH